MFHDQSLQKNVADLLGEGVEPATSDHQLDTHPAELRPAPKEKGGKYCHSEFP